MWKENKYLSSVEKHLKKFYGNFIEESKTFIPPFSKYYHEEMGSPLFKKFVATNYLTQHINLSLIKKHCMFIEDKFRINGKRTVNIDPILLDMEKVLVATTKYRGNRIQIDRDLYLEIELWYHNKEFKPFLWTYKDYMQNVAFFITARKLLKNILKKS